MHERSSKLVQTNKLAQNSEPLQSFGDWLKAARKRAGYRQSDIAKIVGVSSRTISQWERGKQTPAAYAIDSIKERLINWVSYPRPYRVRRVRRVVYSDRKQALTSRKNGENLLGGELAVDAKSVPVDEKSPGSPPTTFSASSTAVSASNDLKFGN